jgi:hypothetical protein
LYRLFDLAQIVERPTDRNLFYKADLAHPPLPAAFVRRATTPDQQDQNGDEGMTGRVSHTTLRLR